MPSKLKTVISMRGEPAYAEKLGELMRRVQRSGVDLGGSRHALVDHALAELARRHGVELPRRAAPFGTNRYGEPQS